MSAATTASAAGGSGGSSPGEAVRALRARVPTWAVALGILVVWVLIWSMTKGTDNLVLPGRSHTETHNAFTGFRDSMLAGRDSNPVMVVTLAIGSAFDSLITFLQELFSVPAFPRPVPEIGWLGVVALATWAGYAVANWRIALLVLASFLSFGFLGFWEESVDTVIMTLAAVAIGLVFGIPLAILLGTRPWTERIIIPVLDVLQTMPTFVYLAPIVLFFGIGAPGAVAATVLYAVPPVIRIAGYGIRNVSGTTIEASDSLGQTGWQRLRKVQLPMARSTIIVGVNQSIMAALAMVTIAAFVDGPGLGGPVLDALEINDIGAGVVASLGIVVTAIMLDRTTTAASQRSVKVARGEGGSPKVRRIALVGGGVVAVVAVLLSRQYLWAANFPATSFGDDLASVLDKGIRTFVQWVAPVTEAFKNLVTYGLLNPMQSVLAGSPWYVTGLAVLLLAAVLGGLRAVLAGVVCLAGIYFLDLWNDTMVTLTMTLVATVLVMLLALVFGVWMARSRRVDFVVRPFLDAMQTLPPFVYLLPALALFDITRFTAIVAAIVYAAPVAIKLVCDGIQGVSATTVEAARSTGSTTWQEITKVQLPMARGQLVLAANQGLLYVLSMVVIGGLVGAGALGYDVALGFSRSEEWGKGACAGLSIVLLGIMLDRIMRSSADSGSRPRRVGG